MSRDRMPSANRFQPPPTSLSDLYFFPMRRCISRSRILMEFRAKQLCGNFIDRSANADRPSHTMTAMPLTHPGFSRPQPTRPPASSTLFQPLDAGVIDASIPAFFVGRDRDGFWLARDAEGENGGVFLFRSSALAFVRRAASPLGCATIFLSERFELDVENRGNPYAIYLKPLVRLMRSRRPQRA